MNSTLKSVTAGMLVAIVVLVGLGVYVGNHVSRAPAVSATSNVTVENGTQIVTIRAKGGYFPAVTEVKAGMPTKIRFVTSGTYDCSAAMTIPSLGVDKMLPPSGNTDVDVGNLAAGTLSGTCGMGMYRFRIEAKR